MEKTIYIPGDLVMTNGIPIGTKKGIVYQVTESNAEKKVKDGNEFTILRGSVTLSNIKGKTFHDEGFLFGDCGAWVKDKGYSLPWYDIPIENAEKCNN